MMNTVKLKDSGVAQRGIALTPVQNWEGGRISRVQDYLAAEEPLEIRVGGTPISVTMRTPGHDLELVAGFLLTESIVSDRSELKSLQTTKAGPGMAGNTIAVELAHGDSAIVDKLQRNFFAASSCGICGKASIEAIHARGIRRPNKEFKIAGDMLCSLPERLQQSQAIFQRTGGLHAAAAFSGSGELLVEREDIGRHNAVDKVIGWALLNDRIPMSECVLVVSGRGGFEIVQKALVAGIPVLASVSAPSSLAVQTARQFGMTLVGFLRGKRFVIYSDQQRII